MIQLDETRLAARDGEVGSGGRHDPDHAGSAFQSGAEPRHASVKAR
jgi:hypothetical protein